MPPFAARKTTAIDLPLVNCSSAAIGMPATKKAIRPCVRPETLVNYCNSDPRLRFGLVSLCLARHKSLRGKGRSSGLNLRE